MEVKGGAVRGRGDHGGAGEDPGAPWAEGGGREREHGRVVCGGGEVLWVMGAVGERDNLMGDTRGKLQCLIGGCHGVQPQHVVLLVHRILHMGVVFVFRATPTCGASVFRSVLGFSLCGYLSRAELLNGETRLQCLVCWAFYTVEL